MVLDAVVRQPERGMGDRWVGVELQVERSVPQDVGVVGLGPAVKQLDGTIRHLQVERYGHLQAERCVPIDAGMG